MTTKQWTALLRQLVQRHGVKAKWWQLWRAA